MWCMLNGCDVSDDSFKNSVLTVFRLDNDRNFQLCTTTSLTPTRHVMDSRKVLDFGLLIRLHCI